MSATSFYKDIEGWRAERDWQMQSARLYRRAAQLRAIRPPRPWLPEVPVSELSAWAAQAVHKARLANYELIALRQLARERTRLISRASISLPASFVGSIQ